MDSIITDRRLTGKDKSVKNRHRFLQKVKQDIKKVVKDNIIDGKIEDIIGKKTYKVSVKRGSIYEPDLIFKKGTGNTKRIHVGNKEFVKGDLVPKPEGGGEGQSGASNSGEGEDDFTFILTQDEFINLFFEDMALPRLFKAKLLGISRPKWKRGGVAKDGPPPRLNILRSFRQAVGRHAALKTPIEDKLVELKKEQAEYEQEVSILREGKLAGEPAFKDRSKDIEELEKELKAIPFLDDIDLRYNRVTKENQPVHQAVMFCLMDVSGSMGEWEKEVSKRFFRLLYIFLYKVYKKIDIRFIRYHSTAREVNEEEFFYSKDSGGTVLSPAYDIMHEIIEKEYDSSWNIYCCHASDGDNYAEDTYNCIDKLQTRILPKLQYYAYIQVMNESDMFISALSTYSRKELWTILNYVEDRFPSTIGKGLVTSIAQIWPVFQKLFEKEGTTNG